MTEDPDDHEDAEPGISPGVVFALTSLAAAAALFGLWLYLTITGN